MASATLSAPSAAPISIVPASSLRNAGLPSSRIRRLLATEARRPPTTAAMKTSSTGFGKRPEYQAKPKTLKDLGKVENKETYAVFVRKVKFAEQEALTKWEKLGELLIEAGTSVEVALKERRSNLAAGVKHQYPALLLLQKGEGLQYGFCLRQETKDGEAEPEVTAIDLSAKQTDETVPAILRVEDGRTPGVPPPRSSRF